MVTTLVTGVGGAGGIGAITSLAATTEHDLVGVDMDPTAPGLHMDATAAAETVPPASTDHWLDAMADVVRTYDVDVVVPTVDEEVARVSDLRETLGSVGVVAPDQGVVDVALDKYRTSRRLADAGHTVPRTWLGTNVDRVRQSAFPVVAKPRRGRGSRGVHRFDARADLAAYVDDTDLSGDEIVVQERIDGVEYTTSLVVTRDDRRLGVVPKEAMEKAGSTVRGATRRAPVVTRSCRRLHGTLTPGGPLNVQQIVADDRAYTIEINPRFSSTACLTVAAGVDELDLLVRDAAGESVSPPETYESGLHILRYLDHVFVPDDRLQEGDDRDETHSEVHHSP